MEVQNYSASHARQACLWVKTLCNEASGEIGRLSKKCPREPLIWLPGANPCANLPTLAELQDDELAHRFEAAGVAIGKLGKFHVTPDERRKISLNAPLVLLLGAKKHTLIKLFRQPDSVRNGFLFVEPGVLHVIRDAALYTALGMPPKDSFLFLCGTLPRLARFP